MSSTEPHDGSDAPEEAGTEDTEFGAFIMSLATSAFLHMGEGEVGPEVKEPVQVDLDMAKHTIDIIGMLYDKTRGNLSAGETKLVETVLYDLRLRFLEAQRKHRRQTIPPS